MKREGFGSRLGFILISAGCAIGLGNVWRFPYIVGEYGGAAFILIYLVFLVIFGLPIMTMEFSVGRASKKSVAESFHKLEPAGSKWHLFGYLGIAANYLLMMFYTTITGMMFAYFFKMLRSDFVGAAQETVSAQYASLTKSPAVLVCLMIFTVIIGFGVCSLGLQNGVEKVTKVMMLALLSIICILAIHVIRIPGASAGLRYYLIPNFAKMRDNGIVNTIFAALGQAFFTLSIGIGAMTIFGSYIDKSKCLFGESIIIALLDTLVAFLSGLIIIPACFAFNIKPDAGPSLIFETLPNVFNSMPGGRIWGTMFFMFMIFAALSTVIAVFESIISCNAEFFGWERKKSCLLNILIVSILSVPCALGYNVLSFIKPLGDGSSILSLEDFIISNNILPIGSLIYVFFCTMEHHGWGWRNFIKEANTGSGIKYPAVLKIYSRYILPFLLILLLIQGYFPNLIKF